MAIPSILYNLYFWNTTNSLISQWWLFCGVWPWDSSRVYLIIHFTNIYLLLLLYFLINIFPLSFLLILITLFLNYMMLHDPPLSFSLILNSFDYLFFSRIITHKMYLNLNYQKYSNNCPKNVLNITKKCPNITLFWEVILKITVQHF